MNSEMKEIAQAPGTISWAALVNTALSGHDANMQFAGVQKTDLALVWAALRKEVHELLCTDSKKYESERAAFSATIKPAIAALAALLTKDYGFPAAAASGLAGLAMLLPIRMAKDAWCAAYSDGASQNESDRRQLQTLITDNAVRSEPSH